LPGLSRDLPFGTPVYNFSIQVTDMGGTGVSSYAPVSIQVIDINNNAPIPTVRFSLRNFSPIIFYHYLESTLDFSRRSSQSKYYSYIY
jgi:hypothetical protein